MSSPLPPADRLPVLPLRDTVVFPTTVTPLLVGRPASLAAIEAAAGADRHLLLVAQRDAELEDAASGDLHRVGVVARIQHLSRLPNGTVKALVEARARVRVTRYTAAGGTVPGALRATVRALPLGGVGDSGAPTDGAAEAEARTVQAATAGLLARFEEYAGLQRRIPAELLSLLHEAPTAERRVWGVAAHLGGSLATRQQLLECADLAALVGQLGEVMDGELEVLRLSQTIDERVRGTIAQNQREYWLGEQLKQIHRELGHDEGDDLAELERQLVARGLPEQAAERARREIRRLRRMPAMSPETAVARSYLDWLLALPWRAPRADDAPAIDLAAAQATLDADHHGLEEVKERILDQLAVLSLAARHAPVADAATPDARPGDARSTGARLTDARPSDAPRAPVLCLVGPPGVGKTSLARSIAAATGRRFVRVSLGGVRDEAEIRGHRRTYVGAMPGRILQALRRAEAVDPVLLLDEIDKMGNDWRGDPAAALLEVLDPEQQHAFSDHFLEIDYDLSRVLFITTANNLGQIPEPLRDRMEVIRLAGYLEPEKLAIAQRYLVPRQLRQCALEPDAVTWDDDVLAAIVRGWTREAGVRELERQIGRVARKLARRVAAGVPAASPAGAAQPVPNARRPRRGRTAGGPDRAMAAALRVRVEELPALLGPPPFDAEDASLDDKVGVCNGLAYTAAGGELLEVEVSVVPGRGRIQLTGTLGDVMKESANAAMSWVRARAAALGIDPEFARTRDVHVHLPAGATPKDGPSAGVTIATALVSALTERPVRGDVAMTGELTLRGRVLPIGGLKEKGVAAHRHRVAHVVVPHGNARGLVELPAEVREGITWHPVRTMDEVLALALRPAAPVAAMTQPTAEPARGRARGGRATPPILPPEPPPERVGVTPTRSRRPAAAERA